VRFAYRLLTLLAGALVLAGNASGHDPVPRNTLLPKDHVRYSATVFPDRIILVLTETPATTQAVNWRTNQAVFEPEAQIVKAHAGAGLHLSAMTVTASTRPLVTDNGLAHHHSVTFEGLEPATLYAYRVRGHGTWSEWLQFRTAAATPEPFSFIYFGDAQNSVKSHFSRVIREAFAEAPRAALMLHAGDLVNLRDGVHDDEWGEWFEAGGFLHAMLPSLPVAGNHEYVYHPDPEDPAAPPRRELSPHWPRQFSVPGNGPSGLEETVYYIDYQGALFVVLDSMLALDDEVLAIRQAEWLDGLLARHPRRWTIVSQHHPMFSVSLGRDNPVLREHWKPVYDRHGVDLVLQGHDHTYGRRNVAEGQQVIDATTGTTYVVSVAGPKMYLVSDDARAEMARTGEDMQLFQIIHLDQDRLSYESRTAVGEVYDAFQIVLNSTGQRRFVDLRPQGTPESVCGNPDLPRPTRCWEGMELVH
jgi:acid phosphatase type 7